MKKPGHAVRLVTAVFQGNLPGDADWPEVLEIASRAWLGPALYVALRRTAQLSEIPPSIRDYLSFLYDRNHERNWRLRAQLLEAISALNLQNVEPILLKGAVNLFTAEANELGSRMISDLDLCIAPFEAAGVKLALESLGYQNAGNEREMSRQNDVGIIELHDRPSLRSAPYLSNDLRASSPKAVRDGAVARIPCPSSRALHLIVHDMIKEGDYWSFRIDLRHLMDLAGLATSGERVDWQRLRAALFDRIGREALVVQARALEDLFGVDIPPYLRAGSIAKLRHLARLVGARRSMAGSIVRLTGNLSLGLNRITVGYTWRGGRKFAQQVHRRLASRSGGSRL